MLFWAAFGKFAENLMIERISTGTRTIVLINHLRNFMAWEKVLLTAFCGCRPSYFAEMSA